MRMKTAALFWSVVIGLTVGSARAGTTYTLTQDFSPMAQFEGDLMDFGYVATTPFELGFGPLFVIGPSQAHYEGTIGLIPATAPPPYSNQPSSVTLANGGSTSNGPAGIDGTVLVDSVSATFAPAISGTLDWGLTIGYGPTASHTWADSITGVTTETFTPTTPAIAIWHQPVASFTAASDDGTQILSITLTYSLEPAVTGGSVPEPSTLALAGIGLAAVIGHYWMAGFASRSANA